MVRQVMDQRTQIIPSLPEAQRLRQQAEELLSRLLANRERSEQFCLETGRRDPMKAVTGKSCLDEAVESTRQMIAHMDSLMAQFEEELAAEPRKPDFSPRVLGAVG